ncbi:hypothetical protein AB1Y20_005976 [Prymnesium parvum]|uniref:Uncharacterized protein n=1 Tax=Prymnesium parvum TaxID=97485 RepID=A0AB34J3K1_PRYPA
MEAALLAAARDGNDAEVERLLANNADINATDEDGDTPLHLAAYHGHAEPVEMLLNKGAEPNAKDPVRVAPRRTERRVAAVAARAACARSARRHAAAGDPPPSRLIHSGGSRGAGGEEGEGRTWGERGAGARGRRDGVTPLHWAAYNGNAGSVEMLLNKGAEPNAKNKVRVAPLRTERRVAAVAARAACARSARRHAAAGDPPPSRLIHSGGSRGAGGEEGEGRTWGERGAGARGRRDGKMPLHWAAEKGHAGPVEMLLNKGAEPNAKDPAAKTPLDYATEQGRFEVVSLLQVPVDDLDSSQVGEL